MILERETIETRKIAIQGDIEKLRETISQLDTKRQELVNNLNALSGAEQQCDHFLSLLEQEENEDIQTTSE
jgi:cell division protein FtsL|tara:strand:- start:230 stop:442 length:213 start_codon:yes stop_codon:yes gene_type:complete